MIWPEMIALNGACCTSKLIIYSSDNRMEISAWFENELLLPISLLQKTTSCRGFLLLSMHVK
jgi:hypothetical protein